MKSYIKTLLGSFVLTAALGAFACVVVNNADSGPGSLRQAILTDIALGGGEITFSNVTGVISLLSPLPPFTTDVQVIGPGASQLTISGASGTGGAVAIFTNAAGASSVLSGLTLSVGAPAIANFGTLTVSDCVVVNGAAPPHITSGGIHNEGSLSVIRCTLAGNRGHPGGAIFTIGAITLCFCTITNNRVEFQRGGGIYNAGNLTADDCAIVGNRYSGGGSGGGLYNDGGSMVLRNCAVTNNVGIEGGGIWNGGCLMVTNCTISLNRATYSSGPVRGGGIFNNGTNHTVILVNTTVSGNSALGSGGGILNLGPLLLVNSTIASNRAMQDDFSSANGGGIWNASAVQAKNTIIAGNRAFLISDNSTLPGSDFFGLLDSLGHNLMGNSSGWTNVGVTAGDLVSVDPLLGPLQDNGGPTWTHALLQGSPAIDAGDAVGAPPTDQRGVPRPQGPAVDIGAYEFQSCVPVFVRMELRCRTNLWLQARGLPGRRYTLLSSANSEHWDTVATLTSAADGSLEYVDCGCGASARRFYRLLGTAP